MSISEKVTEFKKIIDLIVVIIPEVISLVKELVIAIKEIKAV